MQYQLEAADMALVLALTRGATLSAAATKLGVDPSTVFRSLQRIEKRMRQRLFERTPAGYRPSDLAIQLGQHAERIEAELEAARAASQAIEGLVNGTVRLTTTDTVLYGLVLPALKALGAAHPQLQLELTAGNELVNLTKRDADIALRATRKPPEHLVGRHLGPIRAAIFAPRVATKRRAVPPDLLTQPWIAPDDDALPEHPSVQWRRRHVPKAIVRYRINSIQAVMEAIGQGLGIGIAPLFLARGRRDVQQVSPPLDECETALWLLAHPDSRHLRRVSTVFSHLAEAIVLE
jgi:DNA-binding transcriptional LysR family regulator